MAREGKLSFEQARCAASIDLDSCDLWQCLESLQVLAQVRALPISQQVGLSKCTGCPGSFGKMLPCKLSKLGGEVGAKVCLDSMSCSPS